MIRALDLTTYKPNFSDKRVRKRITTVLGWCAQKLVGKKRGARVGWEEMQEVFGNTSQRGLSQWLRANLLEQTDQFQPGVRSNAYVLRRSGYEKIYALMGTQPPSDLEILQRKFADILLGRPLTYKDNGLRRFHEIQNIRRDLRKQLFAGWWDYDIEACAPTLVHQYATQQHQFLHGGSPKPFPAIARLVNDKVAVRHEIAEFACLDLQSTKEVLTMLLFKASTAPHHKNSLFARFKGNRQRFEAFLGHPFVEEFRANVDAMWKLAFEHDDRERHIAGKRPRLFKRASKRRMHIYLGLERRVIDAMPLEVTDGNLVLMHDGFMSAARIETEQFVAAVKDKTGFEVRLSEARLERVAGTDIDLDVREVMKGAADD